MHHRGIISNHRLYNSRCHAKESCHIHSSYVHLVRLHGRNLRVEEVARWVNVVDRLLADALAVIGRRGKVRGSVKRARSVGPWLGSRKLSTRQFNVFLVLRELVIAGGGLDLAGLDLDVEVGNVLRSELLAVGSDDLVAKVLLEVGLDVVRVQRGKLAVGLLLLESSGDGDATFDESGRGAVATASNGATEERVRANVVGGEAILEVASAVAAAAGAVGGLRSGNGAINETSRKVGRSGAVGRLGTEEAVYLVRSGQSVLVTNDGEDSVVVTSLEGTTREDRSSLLVVALHHRAVTHSVKLVHSPDNVLAIARRGLGVVVTEDAGLLDIVGCPSCTAVVLLEGNKGRVGVVNLTSVPLSHVAVDPSRNNIAVGGHILVHGEETVDIDVVEPEEGIESGDIEVAHVSISTTDGAVNVVVDRFEAVGVATSGLDTESSSGSIAPRLPAGEESKDTLTPSHAGLPEDSVQLVVVAARGVGDGTTECSWETVARTPAHLARKRVAPSVGVERVADGDLTLGLGHTDGLVTHRRGNGRLATRGLSSPVVVRDAKSVESPLPSCLLVAWERRNHLLCVQVHSLLRNVRSTLLAFRIQRTS